MQEWSENTPEFRRLCCLSQSFKPSRSEKSLAVFPDCLHFLLVLDHSASTRAWRPVDCPSRQRYLSPLGTVSGISWRRIHLGFPTANIIPNRAQGVCPQNACGVLEEIKLGAVIHRPGPKLPDRWQRCDQASPSFCTDQVPLEYILLDLTVFALFGAGQANTLVLFVRGNVGPESCALLMTCFFLLVFFSFSTGMFFVCCCLVCNNHGIDFGEMFF